MQKKAEKVTERKINIFGSPGSGKTRFAQNLSQVLRIKNIYHLDEYYWKPGWVKTTLQERLSILEKLQEKEEWIIEGSFFNVADFRIRQTNINIHLSTNRLICLSRVIYRYLSNIGRKTIEIAPGCSDKLSIKYLRSIWNYPHEEGKKLLEKFIYPKYPIILKSEMEISEFLSILREINK